MTKGECSQERERSSAATMRAVANPFIQVPVSISNGRGDKDPTSQLFGGSYFNRLRIIPIGRHGTLAVSADRLSGDRIGRCELLSRVCTMWIPFTQCHQANRWKDAKDWSGMQPSRSFAHGPCPNELPH